MLRTPQIAVVAIVIVMVGIAAVVDSNSVPGSKNPTSHQSEPSAKFGKKPKFDGPAHCSPPSFKMKKG